MKRKMNWKVGNSTLRNPNRIMKAFPIFVQLFANKLFDANVFIWALNQVDGFSYKSKSKKVHASFVRSIFRELGLIATINKKEVITDVGHTFLSSPESIQRVFLQQLSKFQFKNGEKAIKPFVIFIKMMNLLLTKGIFSISKDEFQLFVITCMDINDCESQVEKLIEFRNATQNASYSTKKKLKAEWLKQWVIKSYYEDYNRRVSNLIAVFIDHSVEEIKSNLSLLDAVVGSSKGANTKSALQCKNEIIASFEEQNDLQASLNVLTSYYVEMKKKSLISDANLTLNYFAQTGLLLVGKNEISMDNRYTSLLDYLLSEYPTICEDEQTYIQNYCFENELNLMKKLERVEFNNAIIDFLHNLKQSSFLAFMTMFMYLCLTEMKVKAE